MSEAEGKQRLRVLVMTNHLKWFGGSEIVALQIAQSLAALGDEVTLASNIISAPLADHATGLSLTDDVAGLDLAAFDLVWCQHDLLSLVPLSAFEKASREGVPHIAYASLSPFEPYEHIDGISARALLADVYANSSETADAIARSSTLKRDDIHVFHNAAPAAFWRRPASMQSAALRTLLLVSNHLPKELAACAVLLERHGISVRHIGTGGDVRMLDPADLEASDAVVSIGKTISYAIAMGKPAFIYGHFGGDGWLTGDNFAQNRDFNFSGRPHRRRLDPATLAAEITDGYADAAAHSARLGETFDLSAFRLEPHLVALRQRALSRNAGLWRLRRRLKLSSLLTKPWFRAHLETSKRKSEVMRFLRRHIDLPHS